MNRAINDFNQIIIREEEGNDFVIKVKGGGQRIFGNEISSAFAGLSMDEKIAIIVKKFLNSFKINGVTKLLPVTKFRNNDAVVYGDNGKKELHMYIFSPRFKFLSSIIMNKYFVDRYEVLFNTDFKLLEIDNSSDCSKYEIVDDRVKLTLMSDDNILVSERDFLKDLLYYKFAGELAIITEVYDKGNTNKVPDSYVVTCGDLKIILARNYKNSLILSIIREYNYELKERRKNKKGK